MRVLILVAVTACGTSAPDPGPIALVQRGELDAASAKLLAAPEIGGLSGMRAAAQDWQDLSPQRNALRVASRHMLEDAATQALRAGDLPGAAPSLAAGLAAFPADPVFTQLRDDLALAAGQAEPGMAAVAWQTLAELPAEDPALIHEYRGQAGQATLQVRYAPDRITRTLASLEGVTETAAAHALAQVDLEYHVAPDWPAMSAAGDARVHALFSAAGARARWPAADDIQAPSVNAPDLPGAVAQLHAWITAGSAADVPPEPIIDAYIGGCLGALDPWTRIVWPAEIQGWTAHHAGVVNGVGLALRQLSDGAVVVDHPLPDSPAWSSGVHQGDRLDALADETGAVRLDDIPAVDRLDFAESALLGPSGSALRIDITRVDAPLQFTMQRGPVVEETVTGYVRGPNNDWSPWLDEANGIAYVRVRAFRPTTEAAFDALVAPALGRIQALVLDLRANPGGDINSAVQIADRFVEDGWLATIAGRVLPETGPDVDPTTGAPLAQWNQAVPGHALEGTPVWVLVDAETASAAEVLAGSLQERANARVVGAPTWGKGHAQALRAAEAHGYALQLTNLVWALPSGRRLARELGAGAGIQPDLSVVLSPGERFHIARLARIRGALQVHADGTPMLPLATQTREDLPPLSGDPQLVATRLDVAAAMAQAAVAPEQRR